MRYTITEGPNTGKRINISDQYIDTNMRNLDITRQEAVDMYLSDEGLLVNPIVEELTEKAKAAHVGAKATGEKTKRKAPERKPDEVKRAVIAALSEFIGSQEGVSNTTVTNIERMIAFELGGDNYEITLTKKRKPKE
jgi:hypothetical protein